MVIQELRKMIRELSGFTFATQAVEVLQKFMIVYKVRVCRNEAHSDTKYTSKTSIEFKGNIGYQIWNQRFSLHNDVENEGQNIKEKEGGKELSPPP